jgi:rRNA maturation protein Nop10
LIKQAGYTQQSARTGAVTLIQRFGSALNLNIHFHILFLDGVYQVAPDGTRLRFQWVREPTSAQLTQLAHTIARRVGRLLEREGLLEGDTEQLDLGDVLDEEDPMPDLIGHSITYRIAVGPHRGRKVFTLQTLPGSGWDDGSADAPGNVAGFSLHAGVAAKACQRDKLERLCRYICRPPVAEKRLFLTPRGDIGYSLKTPYRDGTTHVIFEPLEFIARLAALVPPPRLNLTRFHGVFAPNSPYRARITPARRGRGAKPTKPAQTEDRDPAEQQSAMRWAQRLKRVFQIDVETCPNCGGSVKVIASIEDPLVIERILRHLASKALPGLWPESRAPPAQRATLLH